MFKRLYLSFGLGIVFLYVVSSLLGWEFFNGGSRSYISSPFVWVGGGFRGGK